jgi:hypothetical protein
MLELYLANRGRSGLSPTGLVPSHPPPRHNPVMKQVMPCQPVGLDVRPSHSPISVTWVRSCRQPIELEVRPKHSPVSVTRDMSCRRSVGTIVSGRPEAQIGFLFLFFLLNLFLNLKTFNITKFKVKNMIAH